jgi:mannose-6-phosphate isomerase-like protein (cupin superfamily)
MPSTVKIITVKPVVNSLQYHHRRDELWVFLDPGAQVELGNDVLRPECGEKLLIPAGQLIGSLPAKVVGLESLKRLRLRWTA